MRGNVRVSATTMVSVWAVSPWALAAITPCHFQQPQSTDRTEFAPTISGIVYEDENRNAKHDPGEPGVADVAVSNGFDVVATDLFGAYTLPALDEMTVFISKPAGYDLPLNACLHPQFYYVHAPYGSPSFVTEYEGIPPTGPLPQSIDFALYRADDPLHFQMVAIGDTQVANHVELSYLRDSLVNDIRQLKHKPAFAIAMGDNVDNTLSLYPRFAAVMKQMGVPVYYVAGNHDLNQDADSDRYSLETYKRYFGPPYYSFNYGDVHFVVLDSVVWDGSDHRGEIDADQMQWLVNDLAHVDRDKLVVLNMHIPLVCWIDRNKTHGRATVGNRQAVYDILEGRRALSLAGHTHTLEHFIAGQQEEGWGQPTPIPQIIVGASCGSWWRGEPDHSGVPNSYQRDAAPKGYMLFDFLGSSFVPTYKASGQPFDKQMNLSFTVTDVGLFDRLPEGVHRRSQLHNVTMLANVWNAPPDATVRFVVDDDITLQGVRDTTAVDPLVYRIQSSVERRLRTKGSTHIWVAPLPCSLEPGLHRLRVEAHDRYGNTYRETRRFEVWDDAPPISCLASSPP